MRILQTLQALALTVMARMLNVVAMAILGVAGLACVTSEVAAPELKVSFDQEPCDQHTRKLVSGFTVISGDVNVVGGDCTNTPDFSTPSRAIDLDGAGTSVTESDQVFAVGNHQLEFSLAGHPFRPGTVLVEFGTFSKEYRLEARQPFMTVRERILLEKPSRLRFTFNRQGEGGPSLDNIVVAKNVRSVQSGFAAPESGSGPESALVKWGVTSNPDGDCRFFLSDDMLLIHVPGSPRPHDVSAELGHHNAPRVLRKVNGDFTVQVKVEGRFQPGSASMLARRTPYNGAGLVVMFDDNNIVTLVRAVLQRSGRLWPYANFEIQKNAKLERFGEETETPIPLDGPIYLRLERRGMTMLGAFSIDGVSWNELEPKILPDNWPARLEVGVVAISNVTDEFNPRFSGLRLDDR